MKCQQKLLHYAKEIIENVYKNMNIDTKYGPMLTNEMDVAANSSTTATGRKLFCIIHAEKK